ncbi:nicotinate-nucleotide--dimethylbenzimidazole phosphoribosyltransferase [Corynebacterium sp. Q4381]|uniref:nicotinate-nucleotide--dimethylbenzimidazole phosphoribosyltransferase n=1 Tax=Corynebacterium sp. Marseille-Q4381 TaxID=3121597 RepID=UPI002FE69262
MSVTFPPVASPNESLRREVIDMLDSSTAGRALGRLGSIGAWVAGVQDSPQPQPFGRARAVVVAGNHGVAQRGVSAWTTDAARAQVEEIEAGGGAVNAAARLAGAGVRLITDYLDSPTGFIDVEPAMTPEACEAAFEAGIAVADQEIDAGTDLIVPGDIGVASTTVAAALYGVFTRTEPVSAIGRGSGINDEVWKVKVEAIRDAMFRVRTFRDDEARVIAEIGGPDVAFLVGLIAQSAARRTPLLIDGALTTTAALTAERMAPGTRQWLIAGQVTPEPCHVGSAQALGLTPVLALDATAGQGVGALAALPTINLAAELVADLAS